MPEELWMELHHIVQKVVTKTIPQKKKCKKVNWFSEEGYKQLRKRQRKRYTNLNAEFQRIARRDKKAFLSEQCKEIEENNGMGKMRDLFKKIQIPREHFMQRWAQ